MYFLSMWLVRECWQCQATPGLLWEIKETCADLHDDQWGQLSYSRTSAKSEDRLRGSFHTEKEQPQCDMGNYIFVSWSDIAGQLIPSLQSLSVPQKLSISEMSLGSLLLKFMATHMWHIRLKKRAVIWSNALLQLWQWTELCCAEMHFGENGTENVLFRHQKASTCLWQDWGDSIRAVALKISWVGGNLTPKQTIFEQFVPLFHVEKLLRLSVFWQCAGTTQKVFTKNVLVLLTVLPTSGKDYRVQLNEPHTKFALTTKRTLHFPQWILIQVNSTVKHTGLE